MEATGKALAMTKKYSDKRRMNAAAQVGNLIPAEGLITVSFVFDGQRHVERHRLNEHELKLMKQLIKDHGALASQQIVWRGAVRCAETVARNAIYEAGSQYTKKLHGKDEAVVESESAAEVLSEETPNVFSAAGLGLQQQEIAAQILATSADLDPQEKTETPNGN